MSTPADLGEDRLVQMLLAELPVARSRRAVHVGAGEDDCAVVRPPGAEYWQLLKTDCVIEGVHFLPDTEPARIGWKALCRPLSDIAATGGTPDYALVTLALSSGANVEWARGVYVGIGRAAQEFGVNVVGGETASTPGPSWIAVCLTGHVPRRECVTRGGGRAGDVLFVTGRLGGSFASGHHLNFRPRLAEARWLVSRFCIRAMMDLSDGLAADLPRLAQASGTGFEIHPAGLPCAEGCTVEHAQSDGEDYELLFAVGLRSAAALTTAWRRRFPGVPLTRIGRLSAPGTTVGIGPTAGYDHFPRPTAAT